MAYCTIEDVQTYVSNFTFDSTSEPKATQVTQMCDDVSDNIIDPVLRRFLELPITDDEGLAYLKQWAVSCVLASVYRAIESEPALSIIYDDKCQAFKDAFMNDPGLVVTPKPGITDQPIVSGSTRPAPKWVKNEVQW
jgi:hypothetical protein